MKLTKKVALMFISVTIISSILYYELGKQIVDAVSTGELQRGPGKTNGIISSIEGEVNKVNSQAREFGEYFSVGIKLDEKYGIEERKKLIDIDGKLEKAPIKNMIIINNEFRIIDAVKTTNIDPNSLEVKNILNQAKIIINDEENISGEKGFFCGIISTENLAYIVAVNRINGEETKDIKYISIITPMESQFIEEKNNETERSFKIVKKDEGDTIDKDILEISTYDRVFYCRRNEKTIDMFTKFDILGDGPQYYLMLTEDRSIRDNDVRKINMFVISIIILTMICNLLLYKFIRAKIVGRIIDVNNVVNRVTTETGLEIKLEDDTYKDEISDLTKDLNNMFRRLKNYADNLEYICSHDLLTSLINRSKLTEYIGELKNAGEEFALFFIDLDNFKNINDTLGHNIGDQLLCQVAKELVECTSDEDVEVSRIGGDEFVVIRKGINDNKEIKAIANNIINKLNKTYEIKNYSYEVKASIGISFHPQHSSEEVNLLQYSDIAMYHSKWAGGNGYNIFKQEMLESLQIEKKIKKGIKNGEFQVYYQPIYNLKKDGIVGAEALIRWKIGDEILHPNKFIPLAKKTGDIVDIDMFVLREAISLCREQIDKGESGFYVSINASKRFLKQKDFVGIIQRELQEKNVPSSALKLEITEDEIIDEIEYTEEILNKVRAMGVNVYLDDFGTGYSSFNYIKTLPIDVIKIDRSLLIDIEEKNNKSIMETMIILCHNLNLKVVCEGVEELGQLEILKELKCDNIQGYYFSKPLPKDQFNNYLKEF